MNQAVVFSEALLAALQTANAQTQVLCRAVVQVLVRYFSVDDVYGGLVSIRLPL